MSSEHLDKIAPGKNRLVLYPLDPEYRISSPGRLAEFLVHCGFVAGISGEEAFAQLRPGEHFMRHLIFVGCSPSVATDENPGAYNNYSVDLITSNDGMTIIAGNRVKSPVCPACGKRTEGISAADGVKILGHQIAWACPECDAITPIEKINWRNKLAVATDFIEVKGVFEGEAIPADKFLQDLAEQTGTGWSYCYC